jgi:hypothetical protein
MWFGFGWYQFWSLGWVLRPEPKPSPKTYFIQVLGLSFSLKKNSATNRMEPLPVCVPAHALQQQKVQPLGASNSIHAISTHQILHAPKFR